MNNEKLQMICQMLDLLDKKEHIFFMTEDEYKEEFDWFITKDAIFYQSFGTYIERPKWAIASLVFNGITFHILNPEKQEKTKYPMIAELKKYDTVILGSYVATFGSDNLCGNLRLFFKDGTDYTIHSEGKLTSDELIKKADEYLVTLQNESLVV